MRAEEAFRILGLPASATPDEIKAAYRSSVKAQHPDQYVDDPRSREAAERQLTRIIEAYRCLRRAAAAAMAMPPGEPDDGSMFSIRREPRLWIAARQRRHSARSGVWRSSRRHLRTWWRAYAAAAFVVWTVVSAFDAMTVRPAADDDLIEQATCYSDNSGQYEECLKARADGRLSGHEVLKPPLLTPYRVSLCATLQARFSRSEFWDCVKALSDPLQ